MEPIKILETDLEVVLEEKMNDPHVAFVYCTAADAVGREPKKGTVSTVFWRVFGQPSKADIKNQIILKKKEDGASLIILITRQGLWSKHMESIYTKAVDSMSAVLLKNNLNHVVFVPIEGPRDKINLELLKPTVYNLYFTLGAKVEIVVNRKFSNRYSRNGETFCDFLDRLREMFSRNAAQDLKRQAMALDQSIQYYTRASVPQYFLIQIDSPSTSENLPGDFDLD